MKNIKNYRFPKCSHYTMVENGIYVDGESFFTGISFEQEPELGEGENAATISQYPLEDLLDKFYVYVSDYYEELNTADSRVCYLEVSSDDINDLRKFRQIIGKHVYNKKITESGHVMEILVIE